jgi:hypothetical protein
MGNALVQSATIQNKAQAGGGFGSVPDGVEVDPVINGIVGDLSENSLLTISGSGFSANRQGQLYYDDFSSGTIGESVTSLDDNHSYKYVNDDAYTGAKSAMWHHVLNDSSLIHPRVELPDNVSEVFVYHAQKIVEINDGSGLEGSPPQIKLTRIVGGGSGTAHDTDLQASTTVQTSISWATLRHKNAGSVDETLTIDMPNFGKWETFISHYKLGTPGVADGAVMQKAYGSHGRVSGGGFYGDSTGATDIKSWTMPSNTETLAQNPTMTQLKKVFVPFFMRSQMDYKIYIDSLFINDSREAVILADNPDIKLADLDSVIALPMTSRANNEVVVTMKKGLLSGKQAYLFLFNANGSYNTVGYDLGVV